ncbi:hypothetical protein H4S06_003331, partial [Coemansia sp. BCRC 34490]
MGNRTFQDYLEHMVKHFMVHGSHGLMQTLLDWRTYGMKVSFNTTSSGHIMWHGADELLYKDIHFTMGDFQGFIHGLVGVTWGVLDQLLFCGDSKPAPVIPWSKLYDDPSQEMAGWSFLLDSQTTWPV